MRALQVLLIVIVVSTTLACGGFSLPNLSRIEEQISTPPAAVVTKAAEMLTAIPTVVPEATAAPATKSPTLSSSGTIEQWAKEALASSEFGDPSWSAAQATGAPNTEVCGDIETAWASANAGTTDEWLVLSFDTPVIPAEILIYETYNPGSVFRVEVIDQNSTYHTIWEGQPKLIDDCPRVFRVTVEGIDFPVGSVRLSIDQSLHESWGEIDAVKLIGKTGS